MNKIIMIITTATTRGEVKVDFVSVVESSKRNAQVLYMSFDFVGSTIRKKKWVLLNKVLHFQ